MPTALVTGGAIRVGKAIALALAKNGYDIALHYNSSKNEAEKTAEEIRRLKVKCHLFQSDFNSNYGSLITDVFNICEDVTLLINNASIFEKCSFLETNEDIFNRHLNINFKAPFFLTKEFAKKCRSGCVINIIDSYVTTDTGAYFIYLLTKKALFEFTRMAALELSPHIRVNGLCPSSMLPTEGHFSKKKTSLEDMLAKLIYLVKNPDITGECVFFDEEAL